MEEYPSIPREIRAGIQCYVFDKLDGANIRAEWSRKRGFYKFGTRTQMLDETYIHPFLGEAPSLIREKYEEDISKIMKKGRIDRATFFFEFYGENSFAGYHYEEEHTVTLFDVSIHKKGMLNPKEFLKLFGKLDIPNLVYMGNITKPFIEKVRSGKVDGVTFEGVVCKAVPRKGKPPIMFKIKSKAWLDKLKGHCGDDKELYERLM